MGRQDAHSRAGGPGRSAFFQVGERRRFFALDEDLNPSIGIDVYAQPFDPERGHCVYVGDKARVLAK